MPSIVALLICFISLFFSQLVVAASSAGTVQTDAFSGVKLVWVPKGCFLPTGIEKIQRFKKPSSQVMEFDVLDGDVLEGNVLDDGSVLMDNKAETNQTCFSHGFWMGMFEITQGQYQQVMHKNPAHFSKGRRYPVENIRWLDARDFLRLLNQATGKHYRLPSEREWEYAAGNAGRKQGSGITADVAWYMNNSDNSTQPVGQKKPNALGLYDMRGNVWEWTMDCWNKDIRVAAKDGLPWTLANCSQRVLRGGSWFDAKALVSIKARLYNATDQTDNNSGFRIVLD